LPGKVATANGACICLLTTAATHTLIGMSLSIVGTAEGCAATLGAHNTTGRGGSAMRFFVYGLRNGLGTRTAPGRKLLPLGGDRLVLDSKLLPRGFHYPTIGLGPARLPRVGLQSIFALCSELVDYVWGCHLMITRVTVTIIAIFVGILCERNTLLRSGMETAGCPPLRKVICGGMIRLTGLSWGFSHFVFCSSKG